MKVVPISNMDSMKLEVLGVIFDEGFVRNHIFLLSFGGLVLYYTAHLIKLWGQTVSLRFEAF